MLLLFPLLACTEPIEPPPWPDLVPGAPVAGAAEGTLDLPVGTPLGGFTARALPGIGKPDNRQSAYSVAFVESAGVHTRPGIRVVWLENGDQDLVITQTDTIYSYDDLVRRVSEDLESRTGLELRGKVVHAATHSHNSYGPFSDQVHFYLGGDRFNEEIFERFVAQVVDVAMEAYENREPVAIGSGWAKDWDPDDTIYRDRRPENDSVTMFEDLGPGNPRKDPYLNVIRIDTTSGDPLALVYTFGIHGTIMGEESSLISSDASGGISAGLEEEFDTPVVVMHLQGAGGDASPSGIGDGPARIESLGDLARDAIMGLYESIPTSSDPIHLETAARHIWEHRSQIRVTRGDTVDWTYRPFETGYVPDEQVYDENGEFISPIDEFNAEFGAAFCGQDAPAISAGKIGSTTYPYSSCTDVGLIAEIIETLFKLEPEDIKLPFPEDMKAGTLATRFGPIPTLLPDGSEEERDFFAGFIPAEPTAMYGEAWRRRADAELGYPLALMIGYAQDHEGYFLPLEDWLAGGYEPGIAIWGPLQAEHVMEGVFEYSDEILSTTGVREDSDPFGYYAPTEYLERSLPTEFLPDLTSDAGTLIDAGPETLWVPDGVTLDLAPKSELRRAQDMVQILWKGGDAMVDEPRVVLERLDGSDWVEVTTRAGRPVTDKYTDILLAHTPDPLYPVTDDQTHYWWAAWQAVGHVHNRLSLETGTYRLHVSGQRYVGGSEHWPWATESYEVASEPFEVVPAELTVEQSDTVEQGEGGLWVSFEAHAEGWRFLDALGYANGTNPIRGELTVQIDGDSQTIAVDPSLISSSRSFLPGLTIGDESAVTVTDEYGNSGSLALPEE